jgi:hypothetical protein
MKNLAIDAGTTDLTSFLSYVLTPGKCTTLQGSLIAAFLFAERA